MTHKHNDNIVHVMTADVQNVLPFDVKMCILPRCQVMSLAHDVELGMKCLGCGIACIGDVIGDSDGIQLRSGKLHPCFVFGQWSILI